MSYSFVVNILESVFSVDVGFDDLEAQAALKRILNDPAQRVIIERELLCLYNDESISWVKLLDNEDYVVYPADDDDDAKSYMTSIFWNQVFPRGN
ncbi:hypothetical protein EXW72_03925 [Pseudomonas sp. BCA14]|uniref:hypothetical protein n=1 Tax=unclassified Pseudomonas TaxID=196821 RepID=UPI00106E3449|nr:MULTISPECIES: hypothetical protein [unclassified Pseudomonas]TFF14541.1 hypothetical protein EXW70_08560 [Pseudomonas sp. JMN1]TFF14775.1 hypothetical protein EXW71_00480 [Pseudomonas sp. BCA17]TFF21558.1 hypothetical protein EXW73_21720 [Pseudomonas sp. BCA13]TFF31181.1 hypothetical protein EXW72_03925 [Pseudomonas sp. BCA14]